MIQHLRDNIDKSKEDAIILTFCCGHLYWSDPKAPPRIDVAVLRAKPVVSYHGRWDLTSSSIQTFYLDISFLLSEGISAECHRSILKYHLSALTSWIFFLMDSWYLSLHALLCDMSTYWVSQVSSRQGWWLSAWRHTWRGAVGISPIKGKHQQDDPWSTPYSPLYLCDQGGRFWG